MQDSTPKTDTEQREFFESALRAFEQASSAVDVDEHCFRLAGHTLRIRFAGDRLAGVLTGALEHLRIPAQPDTEFTICVWDSATTGVEMPRIGCSWNRFTNRGDIWGFNSERFSASFHWVENAICLMDLHRRLAIYWVSCADDLPFWVPASPLRTIFHWCMELSGKQLIHAAAVGTGGGAVLITGRSGVGKSTTALAALRAGLYYLGDDYVAVGLEPEPTVYSLYSTAKLNADQVGKLPEFAALVSNEHALEEEKAVMFLQDVAAQQIRTESPLRAILVPRIQDQTVTGFSTAAAHVTQRAAAFTTLSQLPYAGRQTYEFLRRLSRALPGFYIELGRDLRQIPVAISTFLERPPERKTPGAIEDNNVNGSMPLISIIIPTYNGERFIREAIESVLAQDYPALEIIVVDDGSVDGTQQLIDSLSADIRYYRQAQNRGPAAARNVGIRDAAGEFIAFLDVDDCWPEGNLKLLLEEITSGAEHVVYGHAQMMRFNPDSKEYECVGGPEESFPYYIGSGLYRRTAFETVGLFDEELRFGEDTDWYARAEHANLPRRRLKEVTLYVRRHGANMTSGRNQNELNPLRLVKKMLDRKRGTAGGGIDDQ
jgi:GT2 family glycosyltransferase